MRTDSILLAVCFVAVQTSPIKEWKRTTARMNERMCGSPQNLSYPLVDFAEIEAIEPPLDYGQLRNLHPPWIVVQRCTPSSGCCSKPKAACDVKDVEHVSMMYFHKRKKRFHRIHLKNHSNCMCKTLKDKPK